MGFKKKSLRKLMFGALFWFFFFFLLVWVGETAFYGEKVLNAEPQKKTENKTVFSSYGNLPPPPHPLY